jgi:hypothetical protein
MNQQLSLFPLPVLFLDPQGRNRRRKITMKAPPSPPFRAGENDGGAKQKLASIVIHDF